MQNQERKNKNYLLAKYKKELDNLKKYAKMIHEQNQVMNICGFKTEEEIFDKGIISSLLALENARDFFELDYKNKKILDIGSGAGLPSIPLLLALNNSFELTIIESIKKRCDFLETVKKEFNLNLEIINDRAENVKTKPDYFDFITARALGSVNMIYLISNHLLKKNAEWILLKGKTYKTELNNFQKRFPLEKNNIKSAEYFDDIENDNSALVLIKKEKPTPRG